MKKRIKKRRFKYLLSFIIMILILTSMSIKPMITNIFGEEILIKTKAYNPKDIFRGEYIRLNYDINDIDVSKVDKEILDEIDDNNHSSSQDLKRKKLYVQLNKKDKHYEVDRVTFQKPEQGIYMIGKYEYIMWNKIDTGGPRQIRVSYALDKYFVPENTGRKLEEKVRKGEAFAKLKVYKGHSILKEIVLE